MTPLLLVSASLLAMLGAALLLLWRQERRYRYTREWGWSWVLLALGLSGGPLLQDLFAPGLARDAQALLASTAVMASQLLQLTGALDYCGGRRLRPRQWAPGFVLVMLVLAALGSGDMAQAVLFGALVLGVGAWASAVLLWLHARNGLERWVVLGFIAVGLVHMSSPLLDPQGRSIITYSLGLIVQTVLGLGLMLLSVRRAHDAARREAERFKRLAEHSLQGLVVLRDHQVLYANPAARRMFGRGNLDDDERTDVLADLVEPALRENARARHRRVLADPQARIEWAEPRQGYDGRQLHLHCLSSHLEWDGKPAELLVMLDDSERQTALEALRHQAMHDELTDLPNRNFVIERLRVLTRPLSEPFALVSADLDRFQLVNESLGHAAGDALLLAVAERLRRELPPATTLARLGEDQFLMLVEGCADRAQALDFVQRLLALLERPFAIQGSELFVHLSVGVALFPHHATDGPGLLRAADSAMHRAKARAGASYAFFDAAMNRAAQTRMDAEQALVRALDEGEFRLEYQPKLRAVSRELCGFEALVRWYRPGIGPMSPADFVPAAERTGHIKALGAHILALATQQLRLWQDRFGQVLPVAINVSPLQFEDPGFVPQLLAALDAQQLPHEALQIEITETAAIGHVERVLPQLEGLRAAGVLCALDDFGTGQSSLTMLRQLPIHAMKLDRSMIAPLPQRDASAVVQATCALGQSLGLEIIAEGVETEEQAMAVEALGATQLQGYYFARPLKVELATEMLRSFIERGARP